MLGFVFKPVNMAMNLLPFALIIWGFYQMCWGMNLVSETYTFHTFVKERTWGCDADTFIASCTTPDDFSMGENIQVTHVGNAEGAYNKSSLPFVVIFSLLNVVWMMLFVKNSGLISRPWGTIGYHAANVKAMRMSLYKYWGYVIAFFLALVSFIGVIMVTQSKNDEAENPNFSQAEKDANADQQSKMLIAFANGCFQAAMGIYALLVTAPDTIKYGETVMNLKVSSKPWTASRNVMEKFQDAIAAAAGGDSKYLMDLTGCSKSDVKEILNDVEVIPFETTCIQKVKNKIFCKGNKKADGDDVDAQSDIQQTQISIR